MATASPASPPCMTAALPETMSSAQLWHTNRPVDVSIRSRTGWPHCSHVPAVKVILVSSVFQEVLGEFEGLVGFGEGGRLRPADGEVGPGQRLTQGVEQDVILLEGGRGGVEGLGVAGDAGGPAVV